MIRLSSSKDNKYIIYSGNKYNYSVFEKDAKTGKFEPTQPSIETSLDNLQIANHFDKEVEGEDEFLELETVLIIYKSNIIVDRRMLQENVVENEDDNFIRIYYGSDPKCDLCSIKGRGWIIAAIIISVFALIFISTFLILGIKKICTKKKEKFNLKGIIETLPNDQNQNVEIKNHDNQEESFKPEKMGDSDTFDAFQTNEDEMFQPHKSPNLAHKNEMINANKQGDSISESK
jgi:hypothetical protein